MLDGIFSEGYGIIPKKLMKMKGLSIYCKGIISYLLSYTGAGTMDCWPSINTIANDLDISRPTVIKGLQELEANHIIEKTKMYPGSFNSLNKYHLLILNIEVNEVNITSQQNKGKIEDDSKPDLLPESTALTPESKPDLLPESTALTPEVNLVNPNNNSSNNNSSNNNSIDNIYSLYPWRDINNNKRSTSKSKKDKDKIRKLLKIYSYDDLIKRISLYIKDANEHKAFIQNFSTFLNRLPEVEEVKPEVYQYPANPDNDDTPLTPEQIEKNSKLIREFEVQNAKSL